MPALVPSANNAAGMPVTQTRKQQALPVSGTAARSQPLRSVKPRVSAQPSTASTSRAKQSCGSHPYSPARQDTSFTSSGDEDAAFDEQIRTAAQDLAEHGWASIEGVLPRDVCQEYVASVWDWLEGLGTGISRGDPSTWDASRWPPTFKGIINTLEVCHQDFVWRVRKHPRVLKVFSELWGTNELLSSFDSINISRPGDVPAGGTPSWLHTDQGPRRKGVVCIQGLLNMVDVSAETTGTLMVKDGSHRGHERFWREASVLSEPEKDKLPDFYIFQEPERPFWEQFKSLALSGGAGSLFLWDSRTAHQNCPPAQSGAWRHVVYCCYQDRALATERDLELKREAWDDYRVTTHWPAMNVAIFPKLGADYYKAGGVASAEQGGQSGPAFQIHRTRSNVEDEALLRLAGWEPYPAGEVWRKPPLLQGLTVKPARQ